MLITPDRNRVPGQGFVSVGTREQSDDTLPMDPPAIGGLQGEDPAPLPSAFTDEEALELAAEAYDSATEYVDANYRKRWETNLRFFDSRHAADSKYYRDRYKHRNKHFRPKSRSIARRLEALVANAFFSNPNLINVEPSNPSDPMSAATAHMVQALIDYRLHKSVPWFLTLVGAMQDAIKTGVCVSYNYWCYKTRPDVRVEQALELDPMTGLPIAVEREVPYDRVIEDLPKLELFPIEYLRISPNARWDDPINSSPYVGRIVPMTVADVRGRMTHPDRAGVTWRKCSDGEIISAGQIEDQDSTRATRQTGREDPAADHAEVKDFEIVWPIEWFVDRDGEKWVYWTLGTTKLLTSPVPVKDVYLHGKIPITMGYCVLETHKIMPDGVIGIGAPTQRMINDGMNARADNVALVLNKQWAIRAGQQVDTSNLMYGVPGGVTAFQNPDTDVRPLEWNDVTSSAYQEQDRHNVDYDELVGNFSSSSVMTGRNMNETVGGMEILGEGAATLSEYTVRLFTETWVLPTLRQLAALEQYYESDQKVFNLVGPEARQAYRLNAAPPEMIEVIGNLINEDCVVDVQVGMNATDPNRRLHRFLTACNQVAQFSANMPPAANTAEMAKEVFRILGFGDGSRFWDANQQTKIMLDQTKQVAEQMLREADDMARKIMDAADQRRRNAEQAEEAAMEEQQQLYREKMVLIERGTGAAMKELKIGHEQETLRLQEQVAKLQLQLAAEKAKTAVQSAAKAAAPKPSGEGKPAAPERPVHVTVEMPPAPEPVKRSRRVTLRRNPDGSLSGESSED